MAGTVHPFIFYRAGDRGGLWKLNDLDPGGLIAPWAARASPGSRSPFGLETAQLQRPLKQAPSLQGTDTAQPDTPGKPTDSQPGGGRRGMKPLLILLPCYQRFPSQVWRKVCPDVAQIVLITTRITAANVSVLTTCGARCPLPDVE